MLRYKFVYGRDSWIKNIKITLPHASPRVGAAGEDWAQTNFHGVVLPPPLFLQALSKSAWKGCCCRPLPHLGTVFKQSVLVWSDKQKLPFTPCRKSSATVGYWSTCKHYRQILASGRDVAGSQMTETSNISLYSGGTLWKQKATANGAAANKTQAIPHLWKREKEEWTEAINMNLNHGIGQACGVPYGNSEQNRKLGTKWN